MWGTRHLKGCATIAVLLVSLLLFPAAANAAFAGANGKIAFQRGNALWVMNPDGSGQTALTTEGSTVDSDPAWSPDGQQMAFQRTTFAFPDVTYSIWVMNADGTNQTQLTPAGENGRYPAWSPDGQRIAFDRFGSSADGLGVMNKDGSGITRLITRSGQDIDWSPDGTRIVFNNADGIELVNADGTNDHVLVPDAFDDHLFHPHWSPDSQKIIVSQNPCSASGCCQFGCDQGPFYTLNPETGARTRLDSLNGKAGVFSPDGTKIAYVGQQTSYPQGDIGIFTANLDGTGVSHLEDNGEQPDWQPIPNVYPRPKGATPLRASLVLAFKPCTSPNTNHGEPLSSGSCAPPGQASANLTVGTPDANDQAANFIGSVLMRVFYCPACASAVNEDVFFHAELTDVRNQNLSDYGGELQAHTAVRITDKDNGPAEDQAATVKDFDFAFTVPCAKTDDTSVGSTCSVDTSLQALRPGAVKEGKRAIWALGPVRVYDGGADGLASTQDNTLFATQGVFIP
jgi:hypothetical protein